MYNLLNEYKLSVLFQQQQQAQHQNGADSVLWRIVMRDVALAVYPTHALINHSCDAAVDFVFSASRLTMRAMKTLRQGEEVTVDYGRLFFVTPERERREFLADHYYFDCRLV